MRHKEMVWTLDFAPVEPTLWFFWRKSTQFFLLTHKHLLHVIPKLPNPPGRNFSNNPVKTQVPLYYIESNGCVDDCCIIIFASHFRRWAFSTSRLHRTAPHKSQRKTTPSCCCLWRWNDVVWRNILPHIEHVYTVDFSLAEIPRECDGGTAASP